MIYLIRFIVAIPIFGVVTAIIILLIMACDSWEFVIPAIISFFAVIQLLSNYENVVNNSIKKLKEL